MKRLYLIIYACLLCMAAQAQEQEPGEQLLVFRNTGVVDLLYTNEVDSITTNDTTQVFYAKDTVLVVPIAELDSVAIGSRNEMKFHHGVKELTKAEDMPWIVRFDGQSVFYRQDTPSSILPSVGMKLFYGIEEQLTETTIFPFGLCVKVTNVTRVAEEIRVDVEAVKLNDIFERLFLAGHFSSSKPLTASAQHPARRAPVRANLDLGHTIEMENVGSIGISGNLEIDGDAVISLNIFHNHSHANLKLNYSFEMDITLEAEENTTHHYEALGPNNCIGTFYRLLNLDVATGAFADLSAELNLGVGLQRTYHRQLIWNRNDDENTFEIRDVKAEEPYDDKARVDLTLKGELFFGPMAQFDFTTVGDMVGARCNVKVGPKIVGELSMGMLQQMRDYHSQYYAQGKLDFSGQIALEGYLLRRPWLVFGDVEEHLIDKRDFSFGGYEWNLFPDYAHSCATATTTAASNVNTNVATAIETPTPTDIETGFEIVDPQGEVVDSVFVGTIQAEPEETTEAQTFETDLPLPSSIRQNELEGYTMRPIFHYAGYTISAAPVGIRKDVLVQPYTSTQSNGAMTFISSGPFLASAVGDSTHYQLGAWLPVPLKNNVYKKNKEAGIIVIQPVNDWHAELLTGTWLGTLNNEQLRLTFNEGGTGLYNDKCFTYQLNYPQSGELMISFEDGQAVIYRVFSVTEQELRIADKSEPKVTIVLTKESQEL